MGVCQYCDQEMSDPATTTCKPVPVEIDGESMGAVPHSGESRCRDCGVAPGGNHHPGCDAEICPRCSERLISCGCLDDEDDEIEEGE